MSDQQTYDEVEEQSTSTSTTKEEVLAQVKKMQDDLVSGFTDIRDLERVRQATSSLDTAAMAITLLHDGVQARKDLKDLHDEEDRMNGHYAMERRQHPNIYKELEHSHYEKIGG
jgi:hypothetical protein